MEITLRRDFVPVYADRPVFFLEHAEIAQLVEHNLAKVGVAGPSPVFRSNVLREGNICFDLPRWRNW